VVGPTRVTPGCLDARLYSDINDQNILVLVEEWGSREEFDQQLDAVKFKTLVAVIEFCSEAPVIRIDEVKRCEGIDALPFCRIEG
jgi:quinol monooxygenase YgiN